MSDFNRELEKAIDALVVAARAAAHQDEVLFELSINYDTADFRFVRKDPEMLKRQCVSMRNLRGEWLTPRGGKE